MQLRSGKNTSSETIDTYTWTKLDQAKYQVRQQVRDRQMAYAQEHEKKAVKDILEFLTEIINEFNEPAHDNMDPIMNRIRLATIMYSYINSFSTRTIMSSKLIRIRSALLGQCSLFHKEAETEISKRLAIALETIGDRDPEYINAYYIGHLRSLEYELDTFKERYANRL